MRAPDVEAEITLLSPEAGGRATPALTGYRPQHRVLPEYFTTGVHDYLGSSALSPGSSVLGTITFITPDAYPHSLDVADIIEISEGSRVVGHARIIRILNPLLQREVSPPVVSGGELEIAAALPEDWVAVDARSNDSLVAELHRELSPDHVLFGRRLRAIARRGSRDDVVFESMEGTQTVFVVHLTWKPEANPSWPFTTRFEDFSQFIREWPVEELDD